MRRTAIAVLVALAADVLWAGTAFAQPVNDSFAAAIEIEDLPFDDVVDTTHATRESGEPRPCGSIGSTVWYRFTSPADVDVVADTFGSDFDTVLAAYTGSSLLSLTRVACNDNTDGSRSKIAFRALAGRTYHVQAGGYRSTEGELVLSVELTASIAGVVLSTDGAGIPDVCVIAHDEYGNEISSAFTNGAGLYTIDGLPGGDYRILFEDCGVYDEAEGPLYRSEWYDNRSTFRTADPVTAIDGEVTSGIDAVLALRPRPDLSITKVEIVDRTVRVQGTDTGVATGWSRRVTVEVTNLGDGLPRWSRLHASACPETVGSCETLVSARITVRPGQTVKRSFGWNGVGKVGDWTLTLLANTDDDADWNNNALETDEYYFVGGTGVGAGPECIYRYSIPCIH